MSCSVMRCHEAPCAPGLWQPPYRRAWRMSPVRFRHGSRAPSPSGIEKAAPQAACPPLPSYHGFLHVKFPARLERNRLSVRGRDRRWCASWVRRPPVSSRLPERPPPGPAIEPETHACGTPPTSVPYRERWYEGERRRSSVPRAGPATASPEALREAGPEGRSRCVMKCHEMSCFVMIRPAHPSRNLLRKPPQGGEAARWINWSGLPRPDRFMPAPQGFLSNARIEHKGNMSEFQLLRRDFFVPPTPALPHKRRRGNLEAAARRIALPSGSPSHLAPPSGRGRGRASQRNGPLPGFAYRFRWRGSGPPPGLPRQRYRMHTSRFAVCPVRPLTRPGRALPPFVTPRRSV